MIVRGYAVRPRLGRGVGIVISSALAFALASCGGGGGDDPAPAPSPLPSPPSVPPLSGQPLDRTNIAGISGLPITVYIVNDGDTAATEYTGDLPSIDLPRHRQVTIQIGTAITAIPVYDFDGA